MPEDQIRSIQTESGVERLPADRTGWMAKSFAKHCTVAALSNCVHGLRDPMRACFRHSSSYSK